MHAPDALDVSWRKSSYSVQNGACVELGWRKSSYSIQNGSCVELARTLDLLRDSKNPHGPALTADVPALLAEIRAGRLHA